MTSHLGDESLRETNAIEVGVDKDAEVPLL
jgi:hypothetical protein